MRALIMGLLLVSLSFAQDPKLVKEAEQGDAISQNNLGVVYYNGKGVPQDYAEAFKWYTLAAKQGNAKAQNNLGIMYYFGEGVHADKKKAFVLFGISCENNFKGGCENLERMQKEEL